MCVCVSVCHMVYESNWWAEKAAELQAPADLYTT